MLNRLKAFFSRSTFLAGARRLGWVRLHELSTARREIDALGERLSQSAAAMRRDRDQIDRLSRELSETTQAVGAIAEKLTSSRARVKNLEQKADQLSASRADAEAWARNLIGAMRSREVAGAQNLSFMRTSLARTRQNGALSSFADQERLLLAEIDRLNKVAEGQGQTLHRTYNAESILEQIRAGRMSVVDFSLAMLVGNFPLRSSLLLTSDAEVGEDLKEFAGRGPFKSLAVSAPRVDTAERFDVVITAFDLEALPDPIAALGAAADAVNPGGKLIMLGSRARSTLPEMTDLWRTPPKMLQSLLPDWTWDCFLLVGPGGTIGVEIVDPALLLEIRPALGKGAPLLTPPYMSLVAVARNQSGVERRV